MYTPFYKGLITRRKKNSYNFWNDKTFRVQDIVSMQDPYLNLIYYFSCRKKEIYLFS